MTARRTFLAAAAASCVATPAALRAQTTAHLLLGTAPTDSGMPPVIAQKTGIYRRNGLDVDVQFMGSGAALVVASQEVADSCGDAGHWCISVEGGVRTMPVIAVQPLPQVCCSGSGAAERAFIGPLSQGCLDEALCLAVGARSIGPCSDVPDAHVAADLTKRAREIRRSVIRHDSFDANSTIGEPSHSALHKCCRRVATFVFENFDIGNARSVIDANVGTFPARSAMTGLPAAVAGDAMSDTVLDAAELLDVDVNKLAGRRAFVSDHRLRRVQAVKPIDAAFTRNSSDRSLAAPDRSCDPGVGPALPSQPFHAHFKLIRHRGRHLSRPRRAVGQTGFARETMPLDPFEDRRSRYAQGGGDFVSRLAPVESPHDRQPAALRQLGVLMAHHAKFSQETTDPHLREGVRNLLRDHT
jgi:hypothetical protein